jgi:hypothetical protein
VLFRYPADGGNPHEEPVYNAKVARPDDARHVRAHDLGDRNVELYRYYAARQPDRVVWLYDRASDRLRPLGPVTELATNPPIIDAPTPTTSRSARTTKGGNDR